MRVYDGYLKIDKVEMEQASGKIVMREILKARDAVAILCKVYQKDEYIFITQRRAPTESFIVEVPAGCIEEGEDPRNCAIRETEEEIGRNVLSMISYGSFYVSPGYTTERIHLFYSIVDNIQKNQKLDEDEEIEIITMTEEQTRNFEFFDMKTQLLVEKLLK